MLLPDLAPITRHLRAKASSHLLVSAVHHLNVFEHLAEGEVKRDVLKEKLGLKERPFMVLLPALAAMGLIRWTSDGAIELTEIGQYLTIQHTPNLTGYISLEKDDPGALQITAFLLNDGPQDKLQGVSYVKDDEAASPMDDSDSARFFTDALAGRAEFLSPVVASHLPRIKGHLLDVAAGTGFYTFEWLSLNPDSTATIFDRTEVLKVSREYLEKFIERGKPGAETIKGRITYLSGDMLKDNLPKCDLLLSASLFHDWPSEVCKTLASKFANALNTRGTVWVHDAFLNDSLDGPVAVTDYSTMLFLGTKGRAYSRSEYRQWFSEAGLTNNPINISTLMDYGLIWASKS